jgi:hypothetical protein
MIACTQIWGKNLDYNQMLWSFSYTTHTSSLIKDFDVRHPRVLIKSQLWQRYSQNASQYSNWLRAGLSGDRILVGARFSVPVQTSPGANPASHTVGTGSFPGVESGRGLTLTPHPLLVPRSKNRVELYLYSP